MDVAFASSAPFICVPVLCIFAIISVLCYCTRYLYSPWTKESQHSSTLAVPGCSRCFILVPYLCSFATYFFFIFASIPLRLPLSSFPRTTAPSTFTPPPISSLALTLASPCCHDAGVPGSTDQTLLFMRTLDPIPLFLSSSSSSSSSSCFSSASLFF